MNKHFLIPWITPFLLTIAAVPATAGPVTYNINFVLAAPGTAPDGGSFTWDDTTSTFSSFVVDWYGYRLDFTSVANGAVFGPGIALDPCYAAASTGVEQAFLMLTSCANNANPAYEGGPPTWDAAHFGELGYYDFSFAASPKIGSGVDLFAYGYTLPQPPPATGYGYFSSEATPEPATYLLALPGTLWLLKKRRVPGPPSTAS